MSADFKKFLKCSYNYECSQKETFSSFCDNYLFDDAKSLIRENFGSITIDNFKLPKLSLSKTAYLKQIGNQNFQKISQTTISSSDISNLTFQNVNSEFESNTNNNCHKIYRTSNNSEASFVAMLKLDNDVSKFLVYKNKPQNQFISFCDHSKI